MSKKESLPSRINILHAIPSPRDNIPQVLHFQKDLPYDRLLPKFMREVDAYYLIREYFLEHEEYTHLAIGTDDIIVRPDHILQLANDLAEKDYPVLTGIMNVYQEDVQEINITPKDQIPSIRWNDRVYRWIYRIDLPSYTHEGKQPIIQVGFSGFPLMVIRRDVMEKIHFANDSSTNNIPYPMGGSMDVHFCHNCYQLNIPIFADTRVDMMHLRMSGIMRVDKEAPEVVLWKGKTKQSFSVDWTQKKLNQITTLAKGGHASCSVCGAEADGENYQEACEKLDHAVGLVRNRPCRGGNKHVTWNGYNIQEPEQSVRVPILKRLK